MPTHMIEAAVEAAPGEPEKPAHLVVNSRRLPRARAGSDNRTGSGASPGIQAIRLWRPSPSAEACCRIPMITSMRSDPRFCAECSGAPVAERAQGMEVLRRPTEGELRPRRRLVDGAPAERHPAGGDRDGRTRRRRAT